MEYRFLGRTGVRISKLGFGTMTFGAEADESTSEALFSKCREAGINFFDCADVYASGRSEEILGRLVKSCRDEVVISTKAYFPTGPDQNARGSSRYHLIRAVEASLKRLQTEYVDLFFLHRFDERTGLDETLRAVEDLIRQGKILYGGVSNFAAWQTMKALGIAAREHLSPLVCLQPMYNLVKRQAEVELLPMAQAEGLGVVSYSPLGGGLLSGKYGTHNRPEAGRLVSNKMYQTRYGDATYYDAAQRFTELAQKHGHHPATLAIAWAAAHPAVTAPLIGAKTVEQLAPLLLAKDVDLTSPLYDEIAGLFPAPPPATDRNEEGSAHHYGAR